MSAHAIDWTARLAAEEQLRKLVLTLAANPDPCPPRISIDPAGQRMLAKDGRALSTIPLHVAIRLLVDHLVMERKRLARAQRQTPAKRPRLRVVEGARK